MNQICMIRALLCMIALLVVVAIGIQQPLLRAETDCEQTGVSDNPTGHASGNGHECVGGTGDNPEPVRDCSHKNSEKDNNGDNFAACIPRGNQDSGD